MVESHRRVRRTPTLQIPGLIYQETKTFGCQNYNQLIVLYTAIRFKILCCLHYLMLNKGNVVLIEMLKMICQKIAF